MTYEVETVDGCHIVRGLVPVRDMAALLQAWSEDGTVRLDGQLASLLKVAAVVGTAAALHALRAKCGLERLPVC